MTPLQTLAVASVVLGVCVLCGWYFCDQAIRAAYRLWERVCRGG